MPPWRRRWGKNICDRKDLIEGKHLGRKFFNTPNVFPTSSPGTPNIFLQLNPSSKCFAHLGPPNVFILKCCPPNVFIQLKILSPSTINHQPSTINHQPSTINHQPSTINHQPSTINHQPSTINNRLYTIDHQPSTIDHRPSTINHRLSTIDCSVPQGVSSLCRAEAESPTQSEGSPDLHRRIQGHHSQRLALSIQG